MNSYPTLAQAEVVANNVIAADDAILDVEVAFQSDRKSTRLNSSH